MSEPTNRNGDLEQSPAEGKSWQQRYGFVVAMVVFAVLVILMIVVEKQR